MDQRGHRVLVAEDNSVLSRVLCFNLEAAGYAVTAAANGGEAIRRLQSDTFDLLITDYQMPEVNGEGVCRFAREDANLSDLPIIMCSAKGLELDAVELKERWQIGKLFYKPFSMREMLHCVHAMLQTTPPAACEMTGG